MPRYSMKTIAILLCMVATGAFRSVAIKLFFQLGPESPYFVAILYFLGQSLCVPIHILVNYFLHKDTKDEPAIKSISIHSEASNHSCNSSMTSGSVYSTKEETDTTQVEENDTSVVINEIEYTEKRDVVIESNERELPMGDKTTAFEEQESPDPSFYKGSQEKNVKTNSIMFQSTCTKISRQYHAQQSCVTCVGSEHGITSITRQANQWIHHVPWYFKATIPGFFNLCNSAMRWASLVYVPASVAEMLISGLELVLSIMAARWIRKRFLSSNRWIGAGIVSLGIVGVGSVSLLSEQQQDDEVNENDDQSSQSMEEGIGILLIVGQSIMSVIQDIMEEIFMQESQFPPTLLVGMEGLFALLFALPLYVAVQPLLDFTFSETWEAITENNQSTGVLVVVGITLLVTATAIFNILATAITCAATRNVWKNFRTVLVWVFGLVAYYTSKGDDTVVGEPWLIPDSFFILLAFTVMLVGTHVYYLEQPNQMEQEEGGSKEDDGSEMGEEATGVGVGASGFDNADETPSVSETSSPPS